MHMVQKRDRYETLKDMLFEREGADLSADSLESAFIEHESRFPQTFQRQFGAPGALTRLLPTLAIVMQSHYLMPDSPFPLVAGMIAFNDDLRDSETYLSDSMSLWQKPSLGKIAREAKGGAVFGALAGLAVAAVLGAVKYLGIEGAEQLPWTQLAWTELAMYAPLGATIGAVLQPIRTLIEGAYYTKDQQTRKPGA